MPKPQGRLAGNQRGLVKRSGIGRELGGDIRAFPNMQSVAITEL